MKLISDARRFRRSMAPKRGGGPEDVLIAIEGRPRLVRVALDAASVPTFGCAATPSGTAQSWRAPACCELEPEF